MSQSSVTTVIYAGFAVFASVVLAVAGELTLGMIWSAAGVVMVHAHFQGRD